MHVVRTCTWDSSVRHVGCLRRVVRRRARVARPQREAHHHRNHEAVAERLPAQVHSRNLLLDQWRRTGPGNQFYSPLFSFSLFLLSLCYISLSLSLPCLTEEQALVSLTSYFPPPFLSPLFSLFSSFSLHHLTLLSFSLFFLSLSIYLFRFLVSQRYRLSLASFCLLPSYSSLSFSPLTPSPYLSPYSVSPLHLSPLSVSPICRTRRRRTRFVRRTRAASRTASSRSTPGRTTSASWCTYATQSSDYSCSSEPRTGRTSCPWWRSPSSGKELGV